jgi:two-component system chemotaxis sensor kinase CheA
VDNSKYAALFLTESQEQLLEINNALLELERGESDASVARLFRAVHSMKGMSAAMGYNSVAELSHEMETLFDKLRTGALVVTPVIVDTLFAGADALEQAVSMATANPPEEMDVAGVIQRLNSPSRLRSKPPLVSHERGRAMFASTPRDWIA